MGLSERESGFACENQSESQIGGKGSPFIGRLKVISCGGVLTFG